MRRRKHSLKNRSRNRAWKALSKKMRDEKGACECCGETKNLCVHHILEKRLWPSLYLDERDLIVLCRKCHWKAHNHQSAEFHVWLALNKPEQWQFIVKTACF